MAYFPDPKKPGPQDAALGPLAPFKIVVGKILGFEARQKKKRPFKERFPNSPEYNDPDLLEVQIARSDRELAKYEKPLRRLRGKSLSETGLNALMYAGFKANTEVARARLKVLRDRENQAVSPDEEELSPGDYESPVIADQELSPVFASAGVFAGTVNWQKQIDAAVKAAKSTGQIPQRFVTEEMIRGAYAQRKAAKAVTLAKAVKFGSGILKKIPKGLLPDAELVKISKGIGKAFWPVAVVQVGELAIRKTAEFLERRQFAEMERILAQGNAGLAKAVRKVPKTNPRAPKATKSATRVDPPRPRPPKGSALPGNGKVPTNKPQKNIPLKPVKASVPFATPGQIAGTPPNSRVKAIIASAKVISLISKGAQLSRLFPRDSRPRSQQLGITSSYVPRPQTKTQFQTLTQSGRSTTGTTSGCYTVCRKKSNGKKKRKSPRICVTPARAKSLGLL